MNEALDILSDENKDKLRKKAKPDWMDPMLASLTHDHFSDPDWLFERKLDGERIILHKDDDNVTLYSRNEKKQNSYYPELVTAVGTLNGTFITDAEIVTFDGDVTSFSQLQDRMHHQNPDNDLLERVPVYAYIFDLMYYEGYDLCDLPLAARKSVLKDAFDYNDPLRYTSHRNEHGEKYLTEACKKNWEGLIAKDRTSTYAHSRSKKWLKFKCAHGQEFVIGGFTAPEGERIGFGALLVAYYDGGDLKYAGKVGTGYDDDFLESFGEKLKNAERKTSPYADYDTDDDDIHWVTPKYVGEVEFTEWTSDNKLRHPRFKGLRDDKDPEDVVKEDKRMQKV